MEKLEPVYARFFDIEIWANEEKIEPKGNVKVNIKLADAPEEENTGLKVVHFGVDGLEVMESERKQETTRIIYS